jgi:hypothetical protein
LGDVVVQDVGDQDADGRIVSGSIGNEFLVSADEADAFAADVVAAALELRALSVPTATFEP